MVWPCFAEEVKPAEPAGEVVPVESAEPGAESVLVDVFYLTNRRRYEGRPIADTYSGERGESHFGICRVEFTPIPVISQLAAKIPFYIQKETNRIIHSEPMDEASFWEQIDATAEGTSSNTLVLFVHGYNYGFERTCRMTAEMQRSLKGQATIVAFSWPSNGLPSDYLSDQSDIEWSVPLLASTIKQLSDRFGQVNVRVVAHSLGSRGVIFALQRLAAETLERPVIDKLVLLAPDFDAQTFVELLPGLQYLADGITLYASDKDAPLKLSHRLSGYPRLGEAGDYLTLAEGLDTVDVSSLGRYQFTGHEYFYFHPAVVADLKALLGSGQPAAQRAGLRARQREGRRYWQLGFATRNQDSGSGVGYD